MTNLELVVRLVAAAAAGGVVGVERERLLWAAGLRTHMLVCLGACLAMIVSIHGFGDTVGVEGVVLDPSRVAAQVVSGVSFLGAGTILMRGEVVRGLTTAASLWSVAAVGLAIGGGLYVPGAAATLIILAILAGVKPIARSYQDRLHARQLEFLAPSGALTIDKLRDIAGPRASRVRQFVSRPAERAGCDEVSISFVRLSQTSVDEIARQLTEIDGVTLVKEAR
ncbi:MgtC/SapB family protein [Hansschlegelia quercus]|uniref:Protein MgtC n=1 Tax=Hansschlegelia quercus TaxID=2528245 RepID=A0A4Q9GJA5_9HYPH|nr:MgtC/SapB family protein [Hansschlegelia quercus]TBN53331.1 MgtC/SapB family protein [Hansschlegelia quercus]